MKTKIKTLILAAVLLTAGALTANAGIHKVTVLDANGEYCTIVDDNGMVIYPEPIGECCKGDSCCSGAADSLLAEGSGLMMLDETMGEYAKPVESWMRYLNAVFCGLFLLMALLALIGNGNDRRCHVHMPKPPKKFVTRMFNTVNLDNVSYIYPLEDTENGIFQIRFMTEEGEVSFDYGTLEERDEAYERLLNRIAEEI